MINITKEEMEEFSRIEKIITDTKEMYLFFSNSTEDEIISLCWNDMIMSEKSYMKLFEHKSGAFSNALALNQA